MKFVSTHFTKHHLLHAPHRWFLAFLLSPIHALEVHYQRRYHLQFSHARKLFIFDMLLLSSILVIGSAAIYWYWYDPTVTKQINLSISASALGENNRVKSGELITLKIAYQNNSNRLLEDVNIKVNVPAGFLIHSTPPNFVTTTQSIIVANMKPHEGGELLFTGQFFGEPKKDFPANVELIYHQTKNKNFEVKTAGILTTPADSVLTLTATLPTTIYSSGNWEAPIILKNTGSESLSNIFIPLPTVPGLNFSWSKNDLVKESLLIPILNSHETVTNTLYFSSKLSSNVSELALNIIPQIKVNKQYFNQSSYDTKLLVLNPNLKIYSEWGQAVAEPGEKIPLNLKIANIGNTDLNNLNLIIPLPANLINVTATALANKAIVRGSTLYLSTREFSNLNLISKQETRTIPLFIVISKQPSGGNELSLPITTTAIIPNNTEKFETKINTPVIKLSTFIILTAEAHYYSPEGDQIGRGPLPPKVGKETKYWASLSLTNGPVTASGATISAGLAPGAVWTGKTSVTRGREPVYNSATRTITWTNTTISANETVNLDFELSITPTETQRGKIPLLLTNLRSSATDSLTTKNISAGASSLDASLRTDNLAQEKGVRVQ